VIGLVSPFWRKQQQRFYRVGINRCHHLRRHLAYYVVRHGFEIGDYSHGWPDVRTFGGRLKVGKYCSFAKGATFVLGGQHPSKAVTTFSLENVFGGEKPASRRESRGDIVIGSDVWIASNSLILSGVTIGDGAVVGLGSVVVQDVPPYAIVFGSPARVVAKRFPDDVIAELLELRWWDLPAKEVQALRPLLEETDIDAFLSACRKSRGLPPQHCGRPKALAKTLPAEAVAEPADLRSAQVVAIIKRERATFTSADMERPFDRLGIDSMGMLIIRTEVEALAGTTIDDRRWAGIVTPGDLLNALGASSVPGRRDDTEKNATERRSYALNMPQMALGGLSESWLFKELGDIHWSMLASGLKRPSHMLQDENGNRLYATFIRFRLDATCALASFKENERLELGAAMSRYGAGMYLSDARASGESGSIGARLASSFSRVEAEGSNTSLVRGMPEVPAGCNIPAVPELPEFVRDYRTRRSQILGESIFECEYEIIPSHDINGVGLLYFAAYPTINDICVMRYAGRSFATQYSTVQRDVFYYGNCDPDDLLLYRLHRWTADADTVDMEGSLSRKSDGNPIAGVVTRKIRIGRGTPSGNG
jgi:probable biosynthetic protein (TIGR04098 family)